MADPVDLGGEADAMKDDPVVVALGHDMPPEPTHESVTAEWGIRIA
jgi:hypothetical protein